MSNITNLIRDEWVGRKIKIINAQNKDVLGMKGIIIDETNFFIIINTLKGTKKVSKKGNTFQIMHLGRKVNVKGDLLLASPEERIKTKV